jgi:hypothetical protein
VIVPVLAESGYEALRADHLSDPGVITDQIIQHLAEDRLVVADITSANANVLYELAIRHATSRPVITLVEAGDRIPFDVAAFRAIAIDSTTPGGLATARRDLGEHVHKVQHFVDSADSPVSRALPAWRFCVDKREIPRSLIDSIILSYLVLSFTMERREDLLEDRRCHEARRLLDRLEYQLHLLTNALGMCEPNTFYDLEKHRWKAGRGEP